MNNRERFLAVLHGEKPEGRLPKVEWAAWWDKTYERWEGEGLPKGMDKTESFKYFDLDNQMQAWVTPYSQKYYEQFADKKIDSLDFYHEMKKVMYTDECIEYLRDFFVDAKQHQESGDAVVWMTLLGYFWYPRTLFGIEDHLFAFYDHPDIMLEMNQDLADFNNRMIDAVCEIVTPDFMTFAEDMSYNLGPMLSEDHFNEFLLPFYEQTVPHLKEHGIVPICDTDGMLEPMIPWLKRAGIQGALPLERQAGVDVNRIRSNYPDFILLGGYDKMVMPEGEEAMRKEFERILPCMRAGYYVPSVDHQTPPGVSLENYRIYLKLFDEYVKKATE